jgi:ATP-dependent RNA helicase DDX49/DBP8
MTEAQATMASSKDDTKSEEDSYLSEDSDMNQPDTNDRAPKRRRLSESEEEDDEYVAPAPLPTVSRIKKKDETKKPEATEEEDPITIRDALEIGLRAEESTFGALSVSPWLVGSLTTMAIRRPTAIQKACIPEILKGRDCIGGSRTGSGKTMAFAVPIIQKWAQDPFGIFALVLTPTRYVQFARMNGFRSVKLA